MEELEAQLNYYLTHEHERQRMVAAAHALAIGLHSWNARARFITAVARNVIESHPRGVPWYVPPPSPPTRATYTGCHAEPHGWRNATEAGSFGWTERHQGSQPWR